MTKLGDDILFNCPKCYREQGFSCKLAADNAGTLVCNHDASHRFTIERGMLVEGNGKKK